MLPKRTLPVFLLIITLVLVASNAAVPTSNVALAKANSKESSKIEITAVVGEFYLNVSGFISPFASIVMTLPDGTFMRSSVADQNGNFYISQVLIKRGFSGFCLTAIDFKRIGESTVCFSFPPAEGSITMRDLFLPPTLGLQRREVPEGQDALAFGYTMPGATVTLYLSNGKTITVTADREGYFEIRIKDLKAGSYQLYAMGNYLGRDSQKPTKTVELKMISKLQQVSITSLSFLKKLWNLLTSIGLGPLWLAVPIIILIIILLRKLYPDLFTSIWERLLWLFDKLLRRKKLHHWWFIGY